MGDTQAFRSFGLDELKKLADGNPQLVKLLTLILAAQSVFSKNLIAHVEAVKDIKEATENLKEAAKSKESFVCEEFNVFNDLMKKIFREAFEEALKEVISDFKKILVTTFEPNRSLQQSIQQKRPATKSINIFDDNGG